MSDSPSTDDRLSLTLNHALRLIQEGAVEQAEALLAPLAGLAPSHSDVARVLGVLRLIQGRDAEAEQWHAAQRRAGLRDEDSGLGVALRGIARHRSDLDALGCVVIPAHRMEDSVARALDSVAAAIRFYQAAAGDPQARIHICVVDDASPDDTAARVLRWARENPEQTVTLIVNNRNQGAGRSRNIGAAAGLGRYVWFLDADDFYLEQHLFLTARALDLTPDAGFVRTGMRFDVIDQHVTPAWRAASESSYPCNLCVRRVCHELIGGFPEEAPFHPAVADDVAYGRALHSLFGGIKIAEKTVHYTMRAGNALARQRLEMTGAVQPAPAPPPDTRFMAIEILTQRRLQALKAKRSALVRDGGWNGPPFLTPAAPPVTPPVTADSLVAVGKDRLKAGQRDRAVATLTRALALAPDRADGWFELGVCGHQLQRGALARTAFRAVARLQPQTAEAWFNLGSILLDADASAQALPHLRHALALRPDHASSLLLLGRAKRRLGAAQAGRRDLARASRLEPTRTDAHAASAEAALDLGDGADAAAHARRALRLSPDLHGGHAALARALESLGQRDAALAAWERAILCNPGFGEPFTRRAALRLTRRWGPPPAPVAAGQPGRRLASTALGRNGRFGNQLLQYGALRLCAARHGLTLEAPYWIGRHLFDHDDPLPGPALPRLPEAEGEAAIVAALRGGGADRLADRDVAGYFCGDTGGLAPFKAEFRALFTPGRHLRPLADAALDRLRAAGRSIVALHIRRGDFGWGPFWTAPESWYLRWLESVWPTLDQPALFIATDDPGCLRAFAAYRPLIGRDLADPIDGAEFFTDFLALRHADRVAISNSSFSFVATMLNQRAEAFFRPDRTRQALIAYDPWSAPVLI